MSSRSRPNETVMKRADAGLMPDFSGKSMREVLKDGRDLGLRVVLQGTGLAFQQTPAPGVSLNNIKNVKVSFKPPM
ncbi:MAG: PASTA domain-containing protein [Thermodesulfobacteriota bacterium]|nr:PASTA domain-containing protein [Thermodesulfobacteriota bacterium]